MRFVNLVSLLISGMPVTVPAQTEVYDIATFSPPRGWKTERRQSSINYTDIDEAARTYCLLGVYASTPGSGNPGVDFASEWDGLVRRGFSAGAAPRPAAGRTSSGLSYLEGGAGVTQGRQDSYAHLMVFNAGDRSMSVLTVCTDQAALGVRRAAIQAFLSSLRIHSAAIAAPPPRLPSSSGLVYQVPAGWSRSENAGVVTLARVVDLGFGVKQDFRLVILPPERTAGSPLETYHALWRRLVGAIFNSPIQPLPLRVRLPGGGVLFYDGDTMGLRQNNATIDGFLYAVVNGETVAPIMGYFNGWDDALDRALRQFFNSVQLPGRTGAPQPLFTPQEIAGVWRSSSSTLANWVDVYGNYRGDASIATGETLTIRADGTYESQFAAISSGSRMRQHDVGRFSVEDDFLVFRPNDPGQRQSRYRITGVGRSGDGRGSFLLLGMTRDDFPFLSAGSRRPRAGDLYVSVR
ncbi:MAG: hypothetical protein HY235_27805 [Acidobacteria bacterium]|nr:hypothetical protein [Acidobacteriota bacterium]